MAAQKIQKSDEVRPGAGAGLLDFTDDLVTGSPLEGSCQGLALRDDHLTLGSGHGKESR